MDSVSSGDYVQIINTRPQQEFVLTLSLAAPSTTRRQESVYNVQTEEKQLMGSAVLLGNMHTKETALTS